jgi:hypothetical protein
MTIIAGSSGRISVEKVNEMPHLIEDIAHYCSVGRARMAQRAGADANGICGQPWPKCMSQPRPMSEAIEAAEQVQPVADSLGIRLC